MKDREQIIGKELSEQLMESICEMIFAQLGSQDAQLEVKESTDDGVEMSIRYFDYALMFTKKFAENVVEIDFCLLGSDEKPDFKSIGSKLGSHTLAVARALRQIVLHLQEKHVTIRGKATEKRFNIYSALVDMYHLDNIDLTQIP